jgi:tetratricopeptide (TPR) repeat protein
MSASVKPLEAAVAAKPDDYAARFKLGQAYDAAGKPDKARAQLEKAVELHPDFALARLALAQLALVRGDARSALQNALELLRLRPDNPTGRLLEAAAYLRMRRFDDSRKLLIGLLKENPNDPDALLELGVLNMSEMKYDDAEEPFLRAYSIDPSNLRGLAGVASIRLQQNKPGEAVQLIAAELEKNPQRRELRKELANIEFQAKMYDKAIAVYQGALDQYKDSPAEQADIHFRIGATEGQTGDFNGAIESLKKAMQLVPDNAGYTSRLADFYGRAGKQKESIATYRAALKLDPDNAIVMNNLAYAVADSGGDLDEALGLAQKARQQLPEFSEILDTIGWIYLKKDLHDSAAHVFEDLVEKYPANPMFHYHFAMALVKKGDRAAALDQLDLALLANPGKEDEARIKELQKSLH